MPDTHVNRRKHAVASAPGTGTATLAAALPGFLALGSTHNGKTFSVLWRDGLAWEIATGCAYTHAGTTLTRGTREDSSTGAAISLTSAATVSVIIPASRGAVWDNIAENFGPEVRATLMSGIETPLADSAIVQADSLLTVLLKLIARAEGKAPKPRTIFPTGPVTITAAEDNVTYNTTSTSRAFTVASGIPTTFSGIIVHGPCTWAAAGGVTITDDRASGAGKNRCALTQVGSNQFVLDGMTT